MSCELHVSLNSDRSDHSRSQVNNCMACGAFRCKFRTHGITWHGWWG